MSETNFLRTYMLHCRKVRQGMGAIVREIERRAECHDDSKLLPDEFEGFCRIAETGPKGQRGTVELHYSRNSHHPEFYLNSWEMNFLDVIEMVCDWRAAWIAYGDSELNWMENVEAHCQQKFVTKEIPWLVLDVARFLERSDRHAKEQPS